ncbi:MAG: ferritin-like domain-containing protein [Polyangiaceae bacterium]
MKASLLALRHAVFGAMGATVLACGGKVTWVEDGSGSGGSGASSTSASSSKAATGSTVGVTTGSTMNLCPNPKPVLNPDGSSTPYSICPDGAIDRPSGGFCDPTINHQQCQGTEGFFDCQKDSDCNQAPNGHCVHQPSIEVAGDYCGCVYSCATDKECGGSGACACADIVNGLGYSQCVPNDCLSNADCPSGECGLSSYNDGCSEVVLVACRTPQDVCRVDGQCATGECAPAYIGGQPYNCQQPNCAVGRPLVIDGTARVAEPRVRGDWMAEAARIATAIPHDLRRRAAEHHLAIARLEHASIASFARFALQLVAIGAPAALVRDAHAAAIDEVDHARAAFALASAFAGEPLGPAALGDALAPITQDLESIVEALGEEGCVGETVGVAEALAVAETTSDPFIAAHMRKVAADEQRHAELAWRTLRWLIEKDAGLVGTVERAFERTIAAMGRSVGPSAAAPSVGLLGGAGIDGVRREALRLVVEPARDALLRSAQLPS